MTTFLEDISDLSILIGAIVIVIVAAIIFVRSLQEGLWTATKRFAKFLFENFPCSFTRSGAATVHRPS
jgi:hypothetical protein